MKWLERHAWWGLLFFTLVLVMFGLTDVIVGPAAAAAPRTRSASIVPANVPKVMPCPEYPVATQMCSVNPFLPMYGSPSAG